MKIDLVDGASSSTVPAALPLPPLPTHAGRMEWAGLRFGKPGYTAAQMREYVLADRAARSVPSDYVNSAGILASDMPATVVQKLDAAARAAGVSGPDAPPGTVQTPQAPVR